MAEWRMEDLKVLVADDDLESVALFEELLSGLGVETVYCASSGWEALALLGSEPIDLLICERSLRTMNGLELTRYLRNEPTSPSPTVPIVMISERADHPTLLEARDTGINEFLLKPPSRESLARHIDVVLNVPREFVRSDAYVGPSRRRGARRGYDGSERRALPEIPALASADAGVDPRILAAGKVARKPWVPRRVERAEVEVIPVPGGEEDTVGDER